MPRLRRSPGLAHWPCYLAGMKVRDSSMPDRVLWESFFEPTEILELLSLPVTGRHRGLRLWLWHVHADGGNAHPGTVYGIDIDPEMVRTTARGAHEAGLSNVQGGRAEFRHSRGGRTGRQLQLCDALQHPARGGCARAAAAKPTRSFAPAAGSPSFTGFRIPARLAGRHWRSVLPRKSVSNGCRRRDSTWRARWCNCLPIITAWLAGGRIPEGIQPVPDAEQSQISREMQRVGATPDLEVRVDRSGRVRPV